MQKKHLYTAIFLTLFFVFENKLFAQQNVGIGTTTPAASAMLDIDANNKGLLIPRLTSAQRAAIIAPANGLLLYDTNTKSFWYYNGTAWANMASSAGWALQGNAITAADFMGTTNALPLIFKVDNETAGRLDINDNVFWGRYAGFSNLGFGNIAIGAKALNLNNIGFSNIAIGSGSLNKNIHRSNLVAIGDSALFNNGEGVGPSDSSLAEFNTAIGSKTLFTNTSVFINTV